jgi:hypothetical protein
MIRFWLSAGAFERAKRGEGVPSPVVWRRRASAAPVKTLFSRECPMTLFKLTTADQKW